MYWSQTERESWSLDFMFNQAGHPRTIAPHSRLYLPFAANKRRFPDATRITPSQKPASDMSSSMISITKGRVAQTTKANAARNLPEGLWSVVTSRGPYEKPAEGGTVSKSKVMDVIFYVTKSEAWEESAWARPRQASTSESSSKPSSCLALSSRRAPALTCLSRQTSTDCPDATRTTLSQKPPVA